MTAPGEGLRLSSVFSAVATKRLAAVEVDPSRSNQHEFNGSLELRKVFGTDRRANIPARFLLLEDDPEGGSAESGEITWYDARERHPTRREFRLYFRDNPVIAAAREGDLLVVGLSAESRAVVCVARAGSTVERQLLWLVGVEEPEESEFKQGDLGRELFLAERQILERIGWEAPTRPSDLELIRASFGDSFPTTRDFSEFARKMAGEDCDPIGEPDRAVVLWFETEERLFRALERHIVGQRLSEGFVTENQPDIDGFLSFATQVRQRRVSRAGYAFENHLEAIFRSHGVKFERNRETENASRPDFLFPGSTSYHDPSFPPARLFLLGAKATCRDRWRQVLAEGNRVGDKHLATLEPAISENQTEQMKAHHLNLVVPRSLHETFSKRQRDWLLGVDDFVGLVKEAQRA